MNNNINILDIITEAIHDQEYYDLMKKKFVDMGVSEEEASVAVDAIKTKEEKAEKKLKKEQSKPKVESVPSELSELPEAPISDTEEKPTITVDAEEEKEEEEEIADEEIAGEELTKKSGGKEIEVEKKERKEGDAALDRLYATFTKTLKRYPVKKGMIEDLTYMNTVLNTISNEKDFNEYIQKILALIIQFRTTAKEELAKYPEEECNRTNTKLLRNSDLSAFLSGDDLAGQLKISLARGFLYFYLAFGLYYEPSLVSSRNYNFFYSETYIRKMGSFLQQFFDLANGVKPENLESTFYLFVKKYLNNILDNFKTLFGKKAPLYLKARQDAMFNWVNRKNESFFKEQSDILGLLDTLNKKTFFESKEEDKLSLDVSSKIDYILDVLMEKYIPILLRVYTTATIDDFTNKNYNNKVDEIIFSRFYAPRLIVAAAKRREEKVKEEFGYSDAMETTDDVSGDSSSQMAFRIEQDKDKEITQYLDKEKSDEEIEQEEKDKEVELIELIESIGGNSLTKHINHLNVIALLGDLLVKRWKADNKFIVPIIGSETTIHNVQLVSWLETQQLEDTERGSYSLRTVSGANEITSSEARFLSTFFPLLDRNTIDKEQLKTAVITFNKLLNASHSSGIIQIPLPPEQFNVLTQELGIRLERAAVSRKEAKASTITAKVSTEEGPKPFKEIALTAIEDRIDKNSELYKQLESASSNTLFYLLLTTIVSNKELPHLLKLSSDKEKFNTAKELYTLIVTKVLPYVSKLEQYKDITVNDLITFFVTSSESDIKNLSFNILKNSPKARSIVNSIDTIPKLLKESVEPVEGRVYTSTEAQEEIRNKIFTLFTETIGSPTFASDFVGEIRQFTHFVFSFSSDPLSYLNEEEKQDLVKGNKLYSLKEMLLNGEITPSIRRFLFKKMTAYFENPNAYTSVSEFTREKFESFVTKIKALLQLHISPEFSSLVSNVTGDIIAKDDINLYTLVNKLKNKEKELELKLKELNNKKIELTAKLEQEFSLEDKDDLDDLTIDIETAQKTLAKLKENLPLIIEKEQEQLQLIKDFTNAVDDFEYSDNIVPLQRLLKNDPRFIGILTRPKTGEFMLNPKYEAIYHAILSGRLFTIPKEKAPEEIKPEEPEIKAVEPVVVNEPEPERPKLRLLGGSKPKQQS